MGSAAAAAALVLSSLAPWMPTMVHVTLGTADRMRCAVRSRLAHQVSLIFVSFSFFWIRFAGGCLFRLAQQPFSNNCNSSLISNLCLLSFRRIHALRFQRTRPAFLPVQAMCCGEIRCYRRATLSLLLWRVCCRLLLPGGFSHRHCFPLRWCAVLLPRRLTKTDPSCCWSVYFESGRFYSFRSTKR